MVGVVIMTMAAGLETTQLRIAGFLREEQPGTDECPLEMKTMIVSSVSTQETYPDREFMPRHRAVD